MPMYFAPCREEPLTAVETIVAVLRAPRIEKTCQHRLCNGRKESMTFGVMVIIPVSKTG